MMVFIIIKQLGSFFSLETGLMTRIAEKGRQRIRKRDEDNDYNSRRQ